MTDLSSRMVDAYLTGDLAGACLYGESAGGESSTDIEMVRALARIHLEAGNLARAFALFERAIFLEPTIPAKMDLAYAHLYAGNDQGWDLHEARIPRNLARIGFKPKRPRWTGRPAERLLILPEGGYGDIIQFARFIPLAQKLCKSVVVRIPRGLERLFDQLGVEIDATKGDFPAHDAWCFAMSLPFMLGLGFSDITGDPYLKANPVPRERSTGRPAVGVAWGGSPLHPRDNQRSLPAEHLERLLSTEGIDWHILQVGPHANDLARTQFNGTLSGGNLSDFRDTAEIMASLDLVVTVDTSVAHLAGALGIPTWVMLSTMPDMRYPGHEITSPWYNSQRLFRQEKPGDWAPVVERVRAELSHANLV